MKLFIIVAAAVCTINCAQLNNNYLPPPGAAQSGGGVGLQAPFAGANVPVAPGRPAPPQPARPGVPASAGATRPGVAAGAAPPSQPSGPTIEIVSYENVNNGDGSYKWSYESANGIKAEEMGDVKNKGSENAIQTVQGSYSYTSPEGNLIQITYTADENGFQAVGDALPTPVPLPEENLRAIAEFEAALATAVPEPASPSGGGGGASPPRPPSPPASGPAPPRPAPGGPAAPRPAPGGPAPPRPAPAAPSFGSQPRPGGGSGSYSPQSGYKY